MTPLLEEQLSIPKQAKAIRAFPIPVDGSAMLVNLPIGTLHAFRCRGILMRKHRFRRWRVGRILSGRRLA